ncbi:MAG: MiaB/RimO family radical SAM methylthiotransferase, partial [Clostridia bacterium]
MKVGFVSLGCSKNLIDTEMAIGLFKRNNFEIVNDVEKAEIIIVNTCGFIESAKQEAINTILEMAEHKENGTCKYLVVMGCLVQRYKKELQKALPEVDLFIEINDYGSYWDKILELLDEEEKPDTINNLCYMDRVISTGNKTAYLKIAEGCSNRCTYCAIPYIRGPYVSRPMEEVLEEAKKLATAGIKELIVIAQDTTRYGEDLYGESKLSDLLNELCKIDGFEWIRFLYAYPESITDELIQTVKNNPKICNYFDIPIQHISDSVLRRMNRRTTGKQIEELINKIKKQIPDVILRTSLIVGFPG